MTIRILLISPGGKIRKTYKKALQEHDVSVVAASSFNRLSRTAAARRYHGIAVDLPTKILALRKDKGFVYRILGRFPFVQLNLNKKTGKIKILFDGQPHEGGLADFIDLKCRHARPKKFRYHPRKQIHFNVHISRENNFKNGDYERGVTMDVSAVGCFVYSSREWTAGEDVWLVFRELSDHTPIRAAVRHTITWGDSMSIPGVGLEFIKFKKTQIKEIQEEFLDL